MCANFLNGVEVRCLVTSFRSFYENFDKSQPLAAQRALQAWMEITLPFAPERLLSAAKSQLFGESMSSNTNSDSPYLALYASSTTAKGEDDDEESSAITPMRSPSITNTVKLFTGWQGCWLLSRSNLFTDEMCAALRQCTNQFCSSPWTRLFASWADGNSFTRLVKGLVDYPAATLIVVKTATGQIFGGFALECWRENGSRFFGENGGFLFECLPRFRYFKSSGLGTHFCYLNSKNKSSPKGVGFGGQAECFRLWIAEDFCHSYATSADRTYISGQLVEDAADLLLGPASGSFDDSFQKKFDAKIVEVWGCGDEEDTQTLKRNQRMAEQVRTERRKVEKGRLVDNAFDKEYLLGGQKKFETAR